MNRRFATSVLLATAFLSGCAARGPVFAGLQDLPPQQAELLLYRPDLFAMGGMALKVTLDSREVGLLRNAGWMSIFVTPGQHEVKLSETGLSIQKPLVLKLEFSAGQRRALKVLPGGVSGVLMISPAPVVSMGPWQSQEILLPEALQELRELRRSE